MLHPTQRVRMSSLAASHRLDDRHDAMSLIHSTAQAAEAREGFSRNKGWLLGSGNQVDAGGIAGRLDWDGKPEYAASSVVTSLSSRDASPIRLYLSNMTR
jgi:hypothetical protein